MPREKFNTTNLEAIGVGEVSNDLKTHSFVSRTFIKATGFSENVMFVAPFRLRITKFVMIPTVTFQTTAATATIGVAGAADTLATVTGAADQAAGSVVQGTVSTAPVVPSGTAIVMSTGVSSGTGTFLLQIDYQAEG